MKNYYCTLIAVFISLYSFSQTSVNDGADTLKLQKIIFHASRCNGNCPSIDLCIDSSGNICITREVYKTKSGVDKVLSGQFKGTLTAADYSNLKSLLEACKIGSLNFPAVNCCDAPVITIIVYYNNKKTYLRSMLPPQTANNLISFLTRVGTDNSFARANEVMSIEE